MAAIIDYDLDDRRAGACPVRSFPSRGGDTLLRRPATGAGRDRGGTGSPQPPILELNRGSCKITWTPPWTLTAPPVSPVPNIRAIYDNLLQSRKSPPSAMVGDTKARNLDLRFAVNSTPACWGVRCRRPDRASKDGEGLLRGGLYCRAAGRLLVVPPVIGPTTTGIAVAAATLMPGPNTHTFLRSNWRWLAPDRPD